LLSTASADAVVFGKITDDIQGGQVKIAVTLETLSGVTLANTSVRISRGNGVDAEERERQMAELASEMCSALGFKKKDGANGQHGSSPGDGEKGGDGGQDEAEVKKAQGYEFTLQSCSVSGSDLECWITVRNTRERRTLSVMGRSRLVDQNGATHNAGLLESDGSWEALSTSMWTWRPAFPDGSDSASKVSVGTSRRSRSSTWTPAGSTSSGGT